MRPTIQLAAQSYPILVSSQPEGKCPGPLDDGRGRQRFSFNGYAESLDQGPTSDQARIVLTSLDSIKKNPKVLFDSDTTRSLNKWLLLRDTVLAPPATAFVRVDLITIRHVGGDNDGYFDNITLVALPQTPNVWIWVIAVVLAIAVGIVIYRRTNRIPQHYPRGAGAELG